MPEMNDRISLSGFNNLTKTLTFNLYDICYAETDLEMREYLEYIDQEYNASRLIQILREVAEIIGANILNIASTDYEPYGASGVMLIAEGLKRTSSHDTEMATAKNSDVAMHLDKSHLTVHTYPEKSPRDGLCTFRVDISVSSCGTISPLKVLPYLIRSMESDILTLDYLVRGFTRDHDGRKIFIDHPIDSIQNFIPADTLKLYHAIDSNNYTENWFHTKMMLRDFDLDNYLFGIDSASLPKEQQWQLEQRLRQEMKEIYTG